MSLLRDFLERFAADRDALHRALPPVFAPAHSERLRAFYDEWQAKLDTFDFDTLNREDQADAALFGNLLESERDALTLADRRREETASLLPFAAIVHCDRPGRGTAAAGATRPGEFRRAVTRPVRKNF